MKTKRYRIVLEFTEEEFQQVDKLRKETQLSLTGLVFHILLQKKVDLHVRNRSMDECLEELILLRQGLENGNQDLDIIAQIQQQIQKLGELWLQ